MVIKREMGPDVLTNLGSAIERQKTTLIFLGHAEFSCRTKHTERLDAAYLGLLDRDTGQCRPNHGAGHLHAGGDIRGAANYLQWFGLADINLAEIELVSVRMLFNGEDLGDDDIGKSGCHGHHFLDFEAGHGQQMREGGAVQRRIDETA